VDDLERTLTESQAFDALIGLEVTEITTEFAGGRLLVRDEVLQPFGVVHGGVYAAIAESLASRGTLAGVWPDGSLALGLSNHTSFLRPVSEGTITAAARPLHRGRTTWVWDVEMTDASGKRCAVSRVTIAVRPRDAAQAR
jgi:1,4-dihydroxy-2-naphthoyl-CoA hydrolase